MITVANRLYVDPKYADAFEKVFRERAGLIDGMSGFVSNQVLRPVNEGDPYIVLTTWNSQRRLPGLGALRCVRQRPRAVGDAAQRRLYAL